MADEKLTGYIVSDDTLSGVISEFEEMTGSFSLLDHGLIGTLNYDSATVEEETLIGYVTLKETLSGIISGFEEMTGSFSLFDQGLIGTLTYGSGSTIVEFEGPYFTVPTADVQIFGTKNKKMLDNFTVDATPISDVRTVDTDGYTITVL